MLLTETKEYKDIAKIVNKWLKLRDDSRGEEKKFYLSPSEEDKFFPKYVMRMIREIADYMPAPCLDKIKSNEMNAMGHVDYFNKFVLYCTETYYKLKEKE